MARHRSYSIEFKRQVAQEFLGGESLSGLAKRHDVCRSLIRVWVAKYEGGAFDDEFQAADLLQQYEAKIAALERLVGAPSAGDRVSKGGSKKRTTAQRHAYIRYCRPGGISVARGCQLMGLARSSYYDAPRVAVDEAELVARIQAICEEFERYGYRRVGAALRQQGIVVNGKKVRRLMRKHDLQPQRRRRFVATTDSAHHLPVFPNLARDVVPDGPNQLWVGDLTYVAVAAGFVYAALILDAWSRRVVGYAISRTIDARLAVAALQAAIASRKTSTRVHLPHGPRRSICLDALPPATRRTRAGRLDEPTWQPLRQRESGELHQDPQGRSGLLG